jgi:long-subunit fatty acid transport protein
MTVSSDVLSALGADQRFDARSPNTPPGFVNTLEPHVGLEWYVVPRLAIRLGYSFRPTPVPLQNGDTNILDGDTHSFSAGLGFSFDDPLEIFTKPVHIDLAYQLLLIPDRRADKGSDSALPPYVYSGHVNNVTAAVRYVF